MQPPSPYAPDRRRSTKHLDDARMSSAVVGWDDEPEVSEAMPGHRVRLLAYGSVSGVVIACVRLGMLYGVSDLYSTLGVVSVGIQLAASAFALLYVAVKREAHSIVFFTWVALSTCATLLIDIHNASLHSHRSWMSLITLSLLCVSYELPPYCKTIITAVGLVYVLVVRLEQVSEFGLFTSLGLQNTPCVERHNDWGGPVVLFGLAEDVFVLLTHAALVRVLHAKGNYEELPALIQDIAMCMQGYDIDAARCHLLEIPTHVAAPLHLLLDALVSFQPFIPNSILGFSGSASGLSMSGSANGFGGDDSVPVPGVCTHKATIVFTDIVGSTATWEAFPAGMRDSMHIHNSVVRRCIRRTRGYEVKTVGDAFMIAFDEPVEACNFALRVQMGLAEAAWSEDILTLPHCERNDDGWSGLRVRIGIDEGDLLLEHNAITGRCDYHGITVNRASRLCEGCAGGATIIPSDLYDRIKHVIDAHESMVTPDSLNTLIVPSSLSKRLKFIEELGRERLPKRTRSRTLSMSQAQKKQWRTGVIARVDIRLDESAVDSMGSEGVSRVMGCIERSNGVVANVLSTCVTATWNVMKSCTAHDESSFRFASLVHTLVDTLPDLRTLHTAIATGQLKHGTVGGATQQFATITGPAYHLSTYLLAHAIDQDLHCLYATLVGKEAISALQRYVRPIDVWTIRQPRSTPPVPAPLPKAPDDQLTPRRRSPSSKYEQAVLETRPESVVVYELMVAMIKGSQFVLCNYNGADDAFLGLEAAKDSDNRKEVIVIL